MVAPRWLSELGSLQNPFCALLRDGREYLVRVKITRDWVEIHVRLPKILQVLGVRVPFDTLSLSGHRWVLLPVILVDARYFRFDSISWSVYVGDSLGIFWDWGYFVLL